MKDSLCILIDLELKRFPNKEMNGLGVYSEYGWISEIRGETVTVINSGQYTRYALIEFSETELEGILNVLKAKSIPISAPEEVKDEVFDSSHKQEVFVGMEEVPLCEILIYEKGEDVAIMHNSHLNGRSVLTVFKEKIQEDKLKSVAELRAIADSLLTLASDIEENEKEH